MESSDSGLTIERGFARMEAWLQERNDLRSELAASVRTFFPDGAPGDSESELEAGPETEPEARAARRRHLEWFLFERYSDAVDGVPAERFHAELEANGDEVDAMALATLMESRAGIYEVTEVDPTRGIWMRDLLGLGEYPVDEPEAAGELAVGDLVVGRVYPAGDSVHRLSPAAACFRNPKLREALKRDMESLRIGRRGTLRMAQNELERMFFSATFDTSVQQAQTLAPSARLAAARESLAKLGVDDTLAEELLSELDAEPLDPQRWGIGTGDALGTALERLAIETDVDLEAARAALIQAWQALGDGAREKARKAASARAPVEMPTPDALAPTASPAQVKAALEEFDAARSAGADLDASFDDLERALGLSGPEVTESVDDLPETDPGVGAESELPGVIAALVEEFLWERGRMGDPDVETHRAALAVFVEFAGDLQMLEHLGAKEIIAFLGLWTIEHRRLADAEAAELLLASMESFCNWLNDVQEHPILADLEEPWPVLEHALPRLVEANGFLEPSLGKASQPGFVAIEVTDPSGTVLLASDPKRTVRFDPAMVRHLMPGDLVRISPNAGTGSDDDAPEVLGVYPSVLGGLLDAGV